MLIFLPEQYSAEVLKERTQCQLLRGLLLSMMFLLLLLFTEYILFTSQLCVIEAIEEYKALEIENENCTRYTIIASKDQSFDKTGCPPWYYQNDGQCEERNSYLNGVKFQSQTGQTWVEKYYCMTTDNNGTDVLGGCLVSIFGQSFERISYPLPCNVSQLNEYMCAGLNREGQLCGRCVKGFAPPVYSYSLTCVNCTDYHLNWLKYIGVAFGPLTLFCLFICLFHINATSPYLHGFVFFCQILSSATVLRLLLNGDGYLFVNSEATNSFLNIYLSIIGVWNLDFFITAYKPFCLHPDMTVVQALAINYLIALFPLVLLLATFFLVKLYFKNVRLIVLLWKPFRAILRPCVKNLNIKSSLIESFATLYFLSAMKIQSVSVDLLAPAALHYANGAESEKLYLYLAGDVEYFSGDHLLYGLLASFFLLTFALVPTLLLFLYPCHFCQRFLNKINCNSVILRTFMDVFQGNYKDGTNGTRDYRFFSGIFFCTRFFIVGSFLLLNSQFSLMFFGTITTMLGFSIAILHPQQKYIHYLLDCFILMIISLLIFSKIGASLAHSNFISVHIQSIFVLIAFNLPLLYGFGLVGYWVIIRKKIPQTFAKFVLRKGTKLLHDCTASDQSLLILL